MCPSGEGLFGVVEFTVKVVESGFNFVNGNAYLSLSWIFALIIPTVSNDSTSRVAAFPARVFMEIFMLECRGGNPPRDGIESEKTNAYCIRQLENQHATHPSSLINTCFQWVKGNSSLRAPNGSSFVSLQRCLLRIQQCILMSCRAASEGSWPTSKRQGMSSS
jgi:hypothetical protein